MGLHLNYEMRLPGTASVGDVDRLLATLNAFARGLGFAEVSPVLALRPAQPGLRADDTSQNWLSFWAPLIAEPYEQDLPFLTGDPSTARGFLVNPGDKCESATFGFLLRAGDTGGHLEWFWRCSCKTQYAAVVSNAHLVACHTSLVALLDRACSLGVDVTVRDETHYWETRDEARLIAEVAAMNRVVAAIAGRLMDAAGTVRVEAPIFEHRRFERLEMGETD